MKKTIIILHGWGISGAKYATIALLLIEYGYNVYFPDLPGFGSEKLQKSVMNLDDYVLFVLSFMKKHGIEKTILLGHSFGGRVAAKFAYLYPNKVEKLLITGSPLIKQKLSAKKRVVFLAARLFKNIINFFPLPTQKFLQKMVYFSIKEWDYYKANELRETFKKIISEDLKDILPFVKTPTLLIWGDKDTIIPFSLAKQIQKSMPRAELIVLPAQTHKLPYENPQLFFDSIKTFIV